MIKLGNWYQNTDSRILILICLVGVITHLIAFPFYQVVDADAVTRIHIAERWLDNPRLIYEGVWAPLHHYFNAFCIVLTGNNTTGPILIHNLFAILTVIPIYKFAKREFGNGAWFAALFYILCPVVFRNSFHTLSGVPHAFFIAHVLNSLSKALREDDKRAFIWAGIYSTIAAGFRYESWLLIAIFTGIIVLFKNWKGLIYYWSFAMIFPLFWMIGNYIAHQDFLFGLTGAYNWNIVKEGVNNNVTAIDEILRRIYFPLSWFVFFTPIVFGMMIYAIIRKFKQKRGWNKSWVWAIPFLVLSIVFIYKAIEGTLLLQHRFTISLILLSAPFTALIFEEFRWRPWKKVAIGVLVVSFLPMSYVWMTVQFEDWFTKDSDIQKALIEFRTESIMSMRAIPQLNDQSLVPMAEALKQNLDENDGLVIDFLTWEETYYLAHSSGLNAKQVCIVNGAQHGSVHMKELKQILRKNNQGVIVLRCTSKFREFYTIQGNKMTIPGEDPIHLKLTRLHSNNYAHAFKYEHSTPFSPYESTELIGLCPVENTRDHFRMMIKDDRWWYITCIRKAIDEGKELNEIIEEMIDWVVQDRHSKGLPVHRR